MQNGSVSPRHMSQVELIDQDIHPSALCRMMRMLDRSGEQTPWWWKEHINSHVLQPWHSWTFLFIFMGLTFRAFYTGTVSWTEINVPHGYEADLWSPLIGLMFTFQNGFAEKIKIPWPAGSQDLRVAGWVKMFHLFLLSKPYHCGSVNLFCRIRRFCLE
jgi:hypothetical protein